VLFKLDVCLCVMQIGYLRSAPAACKLQNSASDPTEGLKRRKDEGRIVSIEDDASKRLLELSAKRTFASLRYIVSISCLLWMLASGRAGVVDVRAEAAKTRTRRTLLESLSHGGNTYPLT
jgi:hypothetical protein